MAIHQSEQDSQREMMSMAMLPGLTFALKEALEKLNVCRSTIGLSEYELTDVAIVRRGRPPLPRQLEEAVPKETVTPFDDRPKSESGHRVGPLPPEVHKQKYTKKTRSTIGESVRARWELIKSAKISTAGMRGSPSLALMERARKILERRGDPLPEGLKFAGSKREAKPLTRGQRTTAAKKAFSDAIKENRRLCAEAGVDTLGRNPSKAMVERARKILAERVRRAERKNGSAAQKTAPPKNGVAALNAKRAKRGRPPLKNTDTARSVGAAARWELIKRAGMPIDFKGAPTKEMMEQARAIILKRVNDEAEAKRQAVSQTQAAHQHESEQEIYRQAEEITPAEEVPQEQHIPENDQQ